jgi:putative membrane protein
MNKSRLRLILAITLLVLVGIFALQNIVAVEVRFLFWGFALPRSLLIFVVLAVGIVVGWFLRSAASRHNAG